MRRRLLFASSSALVVSGSVAIAAALAWRRPEVP
jgi:hypothetical protein